MAVNKIRLMTPIGQYHEPVKKACFMAMGFALIVSAAVIIMTMRPVPSEKPDKSSGQGQSEGLLWLTPVTMTNSQWSIMQNSIGTAGDNGAGDLSKKYRLAGTFIAYGGSADKRRAILDDLVGKSQRIISENEEINGVLVVRIFTDRVVMKTPAGEEQLWLSFTNAGKTQEKTEVASTGKKKFTEIQGKFGTQVGEHSWVLDRNTLMAYYNELMNEPQRLVAVFDSMKPIYDNGLIAGYHLDVEGEAEFFEAIGWKQGDVVRSVNSMKMTSRHRAEYFIREFVANRANAFLFDMERDGEQEKLVYRIR